MLVLKTKLCLIKTKAFDFPQGMPFDYTVGIHFNYTVLTYSSGCYVFLLRRISVETYQSYNKGYLSDKMIKYRDIVKN